MAVCVLVCGAQGGEYAGTLPVVLPLLKTKGTKGVGAPGYTPPLPVTAYAAFDFDGDDEYALYLNGVRGRATQARRLPALPSPSAPLPSAPSLTPPPAGGGVDLPPQMRPTHNRSALC